jgi:hypothetical protein
MIVSRPFSLCAFHHIPHKMKILEATENDVGGRIDK